MVDRQFNIANNAGVVFFADLDDDVRELDGVMYRLRHHQLPQHPVILI